MKHLDLNNGETDHGINLLSWGFQPLVLMGLEPMGDNGGNIFSFVVKYYCKMNYNL